MKPVNGQGVFEDRPQRWDSWSVERTHQQDRLDQAAQRRRKMAERLAVELARGGRGRHGIGSDYVASTAVQVKLASSPEAATALQQAPAAIADGGEIGSVTGRALVMYVHGRPGDGWSLVFPFLPFTGLVLVCLDDLPGHCLQIYDDGEQARQAVGELYAAATMALKNGRVGSLGWLPPEPPADTPSP